MPWYAYTDLHPIWAGAALVGLALFLFGLYAVTAAGVALALYGPYDGREVSEVKRVVIFAIAAMIMLAAGAVVVL